VALRLDATGRKVQLSLSTTSAEISLSVAINRVAESVYTRVEATGVWIDPDTKNRILTEIVSTIDTLSIVLLRSVADQTTLDDITALVFAKIQSDTLVTSDDPVLSVLLGPADLLSTAEYIALVIQKITNDTVAINELKSVLFDKPVSDGTSVADIFQRTANFYRSFFDTVALDDLSNIDKYFDATKNNVATAIDEHYWETSKVVADTAAVGELKQLAMHRPVTDESTASDFARWASAKVILDTALITEVVSVDVSKLFHDVGVISDYSSYNQEKVLLDTNTATDHVDLIAQFQRVFLDTIAVEDTSNIDKQWDGSKSNVATVVDISAVTVEKPVVDSTGITDQSHFTLDSVLTENVPLVDSTDLTLAKNLIDSAAMLDTSNIAAIKSVTDTAGPTYDVAKVMYSKPLVDNVTSYDDVVVAGHFYRILADVLSLDDISNVDKSWDATKQNVAFTGDNHYWSTSKALSDSTSVGDLAYVSAQKILTESSTLSDAVIVAQHFRRVYTDSIALTDWYNVSNDRDRFPTDSTTTTDLSQWLLSRLVSDTATVLEETQLSLAKTTSDSAQVTETLQNQVQFQRAFTDTIALDDISNVDKNWDATKQNIASISDISTFSLNRTHTDSALIQEAHQYAANKVLAESIGISEVLTIQITGGSIPVFNGVTFNSSAFG